MNKKALLFCALFLGLFSLQSAWASDSNMPKSGHNSMVVVDGYFNYTKGAWALYRIEDLKKNEKSKVYFSTLEKENRDGKPCFWMEVVVTPEKNDRVVTRFLVEETPKGPGKPLEVIVQPKGMEPFTVPESFLEEAENQPQQSQNVKPQAKVKSVTIRKGDKKFKGYRVKGTDGLGRPVTAVVSNDIPPLGVVEAKTQDLTMKLLNFGQNAKTKVKGTPINFYLWLTLQISKGLSGSNQGSK